MDRPATPIFQVFISVVCVVRNQAHELESLVREISMWLSPLVADYDIVLVDNASSDDSLAVLKRLTSAEGQPNLQVYALGKEVDSDTASWVGLENSLGDYVAIFDPFADDISLLPQMLERAASGADVVFARNTQKPPQTLAYRFGYSVFNVLYKWCTGIHLGNEAPKYRVLSNKVVNYILQHPKPSLIYRQLPATGGFIKANLTYSSAITGKPKATLGGSVDRGMQIIVRTTRAPMRLVTTMSLFGACANLLYSCYVVAIAVFKADVEPGWVSMSLQQSGMFFLISLVLLVLGEYILNMASLSNDAPEYRVTQEFISAHMSRRERLNVEAPQTRVSDAARSHDSGLIRL
jgi:polyisoprenyl-phosphate glycosyltransferase